MLTLAAVLALVVLEPSSPTSPGSLAGTASRSCRSLPLGGMGQVAGWRLHRGQEVELCVPEDWVALDPADGEGIRPSAPDSGVEVRLLDFLPLGEGTYGNFDRWLRDHRLRGKPLRVGRHRALRVQRRPTGGGVAVETFIAVPHTKSHGGVVEIFQLSARQGDPNLRKWTAIYDQMLASLRLLAPAVPTGKGE